MHFFNQQNPTFQDWLMDPGNLLEVKQRNLSVTPSERIIDVLESLGESFFENGFPESLKSALEEESGFNRAEVEGSLGVLPQLLSRESLEKRLRSEFTRAEILDRFAKLPHQETLIRALPRGPLLHVTAGNVFLSSIDSLIMGLLTKNVSLVKLSSTNRAFPAFFVAALKEIDREEILIDKFAFLHWKGGEVGIETTLKNRVRTIIAWGGEEMITAYAKDLPPSVKFLDFGPKVSLQIISRKGLESEALKEVAARIVRDILPWNQQACASPQNLFIEEGIEEGELLLAIEDALKASTPRGAITDDEAVEILKEKYRGLYSELMEEGRIRSGGDYLLHLEGDKNLRPSPLNRSLILKRFSSATDLGKGLAPFAFYLQSASYLLAPEEKESYLYELATAGIKRFAPLGTITFGKDGAPHDGRFILRELVTFVGDEIRAVGETKGETTNSGDLKRIFEASSHPPGYLFSSGGTTGEPKYVHFSYEEFDFITDMLAKNFRAQGVRPGMLAANLFVAGNLWSSFMAVEKALEKIGVVQLPIGGLASPENIQTYLERFRPEAVLGIPSLLVQTAEAMRAKGSEFRVAKIFYAGEPLSESRQNFFRDVWEVQSFGSAGYASVDAGVIGYQCGDSGPGEHHLFSDLVQMKIIDGEAVVSSLYRTSLPIKNYRTGDRVEFIGPCSCGDPNPRFRLLGRADGLIMIFSARIRLEDVERALRSVAPGILSYQISLSEGPQGSELFTLTVERNQAVSEADLLRSVYELCQDLRDTLSWENFSGRARVVAVEPGMIPRNARTGKITPVIDRR